MPLVSVILPVYNGSRYIALAISSLLLQSDDLEIIVSDDRSSDETIAVVESFRADNIKLITNNRNVGLFANLNRALAVAEGKYVQIFSQDDIALPGFIRSQVACLSEERIGLTYASCNIIDENGRRFATVDDEGTPEVIDFATYLWIASRYGSLPTSISCVMFARSILPSVGAFDERFYVAGDLEFYNRVAEKYNVKRNRSVLLEVRHHSQSLTMKAGSQLRYMREEIEILKYFQKHIPRREYNEVMAIRERTRGADHAKYLLRLGFRGYLKEFWEGMFLLSRVHRVPVCMMFAMSQFMRSRLRGSKSVSIPDGGRVC